jgi:hypothetical protein
MKRTLAILSLGLALTATTPLAALADSKTDQSNVPTELRVPVGYRRVMHTTGRGVQIYACTNGTWTLKEPRAGIYSEPSGKQIATHYVGPTWESIKDHSKVVGAVDARLNAPNPQQDIQWLRLKAASNSGKGTFDDIAYIQRLNTVGGVAPAGSCSANQTAEVPYRATYDFWAPANHGHHFADD